MLADLDLEEIAGLAGDRVAGDDLVDVREPLRGVVGGARVERLDRDERRHLQTELRGLQHGAVALDHPALLQASHPLLRGGGGEARLLADVGVGHPAVSRQQRENALVQLLHGVIVPGSDPCEREKFCFWTRRRCTSARSTASPTRCGRRTGCRSTPSAVCSTSSPAWSTSTPPPTWRAAGTTTGARVARRAAALVQGAPRGRGDTGRTGGTSVISEMSTSADTAGRVRARRPGRPRCRWIREVLIALGIRMVGADGYEADDVIGTARHDAADPRRRGDRRPRPLPGGGRRPRGPRPLHRPRRRQARAGRRRLGAGALRGARGARTSTSPRCAATRPTVCPGSPGSGTRPPPA